MEPRFKLTCRLPRRPRGSWPVSAARISLYVVLAWLGIAAVAVLNNKTWP